MGYASYMKYDSSGKEIKPEGKNPDAAYFENAVKAFSERMDSEKEEMQSLHDSIEEYQTSILELEQKRNELIQEMIDN
jgi:predicted RNase H-like nuclease (RuvC/YqgF family)